MKVKFKRLDPNAKIPTKGYPMSAGYDLYPMAAGIIQPGERVAIPLGFATEFPANYVAQIDDRGGCGFVGLTHLAGVIDSDFRGEWVVIMYNTSKEPYKYDQHKGIAQVLFIEVENADFEITDTLSPSLRGEGKHGSSNVKPTGRVLHLSASNDLKIGQGTGAPPEGSGYVPTQGQ